MATDEQLEKEFKRIDKNNDKSITITELKNYYLPMQEMLGIAPQLAEQEIQGLIKRLDTDHNGTISLEGK
jgi:Ca2+-binding EF-hand superfamily protein